MLILKQATTDKLQLVTSSAAQIYVHASYSDNNSGTITSDRELHSISSATTSDIVATPGTSGVIRNVKTLHIRNGDASLSNTVTVLYNNNSTTYELHKVTLLAGDQLEYIEGVGFFKIQNVSTTTDNASTSSQSGFSSDTYLAGSSIQVPIGAPIVSTRYRCWFDLTKTALGTGVPTVTVRFGTNGSISDTAVATLALAAGTAAADSGMIELHLAFRSVGSGTSAVFEAFLGLTSNLTTTGLSNVVKAKQATSSGFDSTVSNSFIGVSYNGGASAVHTIQQVIAEWFT